LYRLPLGSTAARTPDVLRARNVRYLYSPSCREEVFSDTEHSPAPMGVCDRGPTTAIKDARSVKSDRKGVPRVSEAPTREVSGRFLSHLRGASMFPPVRRKP